MIKQLRRKQEKHRSLSEIKRLSRYVKGGREIHNERERERERERGGGGEREGERDTERHREREGGRERERERKRERGRERPSPQKFKTSGQVIMKCTRAR